MEIKVPCAYQGGKQRISKEIVNYIYDNVNINKDTIFFDLCSGSGAITVELINKGFPKKNIVMCDVSSWGTFWKSISDGVYDIKKFLKYANSVPKDKNLIQSYITKLASEDARIDEEYKYILIQACSFGGKQIWREGSEWKNASFRSYWQPTETSKRRSPVNPMQPNIETLIERVVEISENCKGLTCINNDVFSVLSMIPQENCIIYIDPPYENTTGYGFSFDYNTFLRELSKITHSPIFVSEKEKIANKAIKLQFNGAKGGISGNKSLKHEEWLNIFT